MSDVWVVSVSIDDDNEEIAGPYTETQAKRVAKRLDEEVRLSEDDYGYSHHPHSVVGANAWPLSRWDKFLTGEERQQARRDVRHSNNEPREYE